MKLTLLDMVQSTLSSLDSDEVNSISDNPESMQVARLIKSKYYDIVSRGELTEHNQIIQLTPSNDPTKPTLMYAPAGVCKIDWVKYYNSGTDADEENEAFEHDLNLDLDEEINEDALVTPPGYQYVSVVAVKTFFDLIGALNPNNSDVGSYILHDDSNLYPSDFTVFYRNNTQPSFCCILSNHYVLFDSFNHDLDSTLQESKTLCSGQVVPAFQLVDTFIPNLDDQQFPLLLNEVKSLAFYELKQVAHQKADQEIKRQWSTIQKNKSMSNKPSYFDQLADFGRNKGIRSGTKWTR